MVEEIQTIIRTEGDMDFKIYTEDAIGKMTFEKADNILNNVFLSLMVEKGSFFQNPDFGSRLHLLKRAKNTEKTAALAEEYCKEALQWLIDTGRAKKIDVYSERERLQDLNRLKLLVEVTQSDGRQVRFETFVEVV
jgi:phage gp46-like protein